MKKIAGTLSIVITICFLSMISCTKVYHCTCTYNNAVTLNKDLGSQTKSNATNECNNYDTTVAGEVWTCTIY